MIRHIVLVRIAPATSPAAIDAAFGALAALKDDVPGLLAFKHGANVSPEPLARGFTHGFTVDFESEAARDAYLVHPAHQRAGAQLVAVAEGGLDGLIVLDFVL